MDFKDSFAHWMFLTKRKFPIYENEMDLFYKWYEENKEPPANTIERLYEEYKINTRLYNALTDANVYRLEDLANYKRQEIESLKNVGTKSMFELDEAMSNCSIQFKN